LSVGCSAFSVGRSLRPREIQNHVAFQRFSISAFR
jgi:hypothetical protein